MSQASSFEYQFTDDRTEEHTKLQSEDAIGL